jgi:hypothetical protein
MFAGPAARCLKRESHNALDSVAGEDRDFSRDGPGFVQMGSSTVAGILPLTVFPYDDPVQITCLAIAERGGGATEDSSRTDVGILLERLAKG